MSPPLTKDEADCIFHLLPPSNQKSPEVSAASGMWRGFLFAFWARKTAQKHMGPMPHQPFQENPNRQKRRQVFILVDIGYSQPKFDVCFLY